MTTRVFAYGSNLDSRRMRGRVPSARVEVAARLRGWTLRFNKRGSLDGTGKANVVRTGRSGDVVPGVVYRLHPSDLPELDGVEGGYDRIRRPVVASDGGARASRPAWLYVARPETVDDGLRPARWYLDHVLRGAREHRLPSGHISFLEAVAAGAPPAR